MKGRSKLLEVSFISHLAKCFQGKHAAYSQLKPSRNLYGKKGLIKEPWNYLKQRI